MEQESSSLDMINYVRCSGNCAKKKWDRSITKSKTVLIGGEYTEPESSLCISL